MWFISFLGNPSAVLEKGPKSLVAPWGFDGATSMLRLYGSSSLHTVGTLFTLCFVFQLCPSNDAMSIVSKKHYLNSMHLIWVNFRLKKNVDLPVVWVYRKDMLSFRDLYFWINFMDFPFRKFFIDVPFPRKTFNSPRPKDPKSEPRRLEKWSAGKLLGRGGWKGFVV